MWTVLTETDRLLIRRFEAGDEQLLARIFCDPGMMRYLGGPWDAPQLAEALQEWRGDWGVANRWHGMLVRKDTAQAVGTAGIAADTLRDEPGVELTWFVLPEHQGRGYAGEISRALLRLAFDGLGAERVVAETHPDNPAANRLLHRLGFTCLGERRYQYEDLPGFDRQAVWALTRQTHRLDQIISRVPA